MASGPRRDLPGRRRPRPPSRPPRRPRARRDRRRRPASPCGDRRGRRSCHRAGRRCRARRSRRRSPRSRRRAPRRPSTTSAMRSDSFTRSSWAPCTIVSPSAKQPSSATRGSSSIASGTSSASTTVPSSAPWATSRSLMGSCTESSPDSSSRSPSTIPRIRRTMRRKPVRVQLTPTSPSSRREPGTSTPAATMNAAELGSPGTRTRSSTSSSALTTVTWRPLRWMFTPARRSIRSVWSRLRAGSPMVVAPSAASAASSTHDLTCALATGSS